MATSASTNGSAAYGVELATDDTARSGQTAVTRSGNKKIRSIAFAATLAAVAAWSTLLSAESPSHDRQTITPAFKEMVPNIPGKSLVGLVVTHPPGGATPVHSHPRSAFVIGYVLTGSIRSQVDHGKTQVFHAGEHWTEPTGAYHPISENASATEPASLLAVFVVDTTDADRLVTYEQK